MKKIFGVLLLICCVVKADVVAQDFSVAFKAGQNFSKIEGNDAKQTIPGLNREISPEGISGFTGGLSLGYTFYSMFSVQLEAIYAKKGVRYQDKFSLFSGFPIPIPIPISNDTISFTGIFTGSYFEVPLLIAITPDFGFPLKPTLYTGPNFAFLTSQSQDVKYEGEILDSPIQLLGPFPVRIRPRDLVPPVHYGLKDFDMGWTFGGGLLYSFLKTASVGVEARYTMGFNGAVDSVGFGASSFAGFPIQEGSTQKNPDIKNRSLSILAVLRYNF